MELKERIRIARKHFDLSQKEFGDRIGVAANTVTNYETGLRTPKEQTIKSICREFNISYDWLKNGIEPMIASRDDDLPAIIDTILAGENETAKILFRAFTKFDDKDWEVIRKIIEEFKKAD